jgi:hypothetical protein
METGFPIQGNLFLNILFQEINTLFFIIDI